jgi:hypothetical protein
LFAALSGDKAGEASTTLSDIASGVQVLANGITALANAYGKLSTFTKSSGYQKALDLVFGTKDGKFGSVLNPFGKNFLGAGNLVNSLGGSRAAGGSVMGGGAYRVGEFGPEMFVPSGSGSIRPDNGAGQGVTIIMNGVIDGESARRSIERLLQDSSRRTGAVNLVGATL